MIICHSLTQNLEDVFKGYQAQIPTLEEDPDLTPLLKVVDDLTFRQLLMKPLKPEVKKLMVVSFQQSID
jgi:hypothetical protein